MTRDIADIGFNGRIIYAPGEYIAEYGCVSFPHYSETPTGDDGERMIYVSNSAEWTSTGTDEVRESNYRSLIRDGGTVLEGTGYFLYVSHVYGNVLALDITDRDTDENVRMWLDVLIRLDDEYPLYDEEDYSSLQWENQNEYLVCDAVYDFRRHISEDDSDKLTDEQITAALRTAVESHDYFGDWDGTGYRAWADIATFAAEILGVVYSG